MNITVVEKAQNRWQQFLAGTVQLWLREADSQEPGQVLVMEKAAEARIPREH